MKICERIFDYAEEDVIVCKKLLVCEEKKSKINWYIILLSILSIWVFRLHIMYELAPQTAQIYNLSPLFQRYEHWWWSFFFFTHPFTHSPAQDIFLTCKVPIFEIWKYQYVFFLFIFYYNSKKNCWLTTCGDSNL